MGCNAVMDLSDGSAHLFIPDVDASTKIWMRVLEKEEAQDLYNDMEIHFNSKLEDFVKERGSTMVYVNKGKSDVSGREVLCPDFDWLCDCNVNEKALLSVLAEARVYKTEEELKILKVANCVSAESHVHVMRNCRPKLRESTLSSMFKAYAEMNYNCKIQPYENICASGPNPSILHYMDNNDIIPEVSMVLMDCGHQIHHYGADVTCTFPANGTFTQKQKEIYNIVLKANRDV